MAVLIEILKVLVISLGQKLIEKGMERSSWFRGKVEKRREKQRAKGEVVSETEVGAEGDIVGETEVETKDGNISKGGMA